MVTATNGEQKLPDEMDELQLSLLAELPNHFVQTL